MRTIVSGSEVQDMEVSSEDFILEHYVIREGISLFHGKFSTYKTPTTVHIAKAICTGQELWGLKAEKATPVLYVEADTPRNAILPRLKGINVAVPGLDFCFCYPGFNMVSPVTGEKSGELYQELYTAHREKRYKFVVIDALKRIHRLKTTDVDTPTVVYEAVSTLFDKAAILIIHHDKKTKLLERGQSPSPHELKELSAEAFSGSQGWIDHATVSIHCKMVGDNCMSLVHTKSQAGETQHPLILTMIDGGTQIISQPIDGNDEALVIYVNKLLDDGLALTDIDKELANYLGVSVRTARRKRKSLAEITEIRQPSP